MKNMEKNSLSKPSKVNQFKLLVMFFIALFAGIAYLNWRAFSTINYGAGQFAVIWSFILLACEIYTFMIFSSFSLALIRKDANPIDKYPRNMKEGYETYSPSVDIYVCTMNESLDILSDTLLGCINIDYPNKKVYVLDDGRRPEVKELADQLGCNYITRPDNRGYKAGNINNALRQTNGELVVIFDADHVPVSTFLLDTVFHFKDREVALIQTPQHFFNPDPFQKNLSLEKHIANEQDLFYRAIEPGLASFGSAVCCGTNFIVRRQYVDEVGGLPENTITEDSALGLMLESKGYNILYYNKPIAAGRAPETFAEYLKQRTRWAIGNLQIFFSFSNLKYLLRLTPVQLFFYINGMLYFLYAFPRIVYLLTPVLFLLWDVTPVTAVVYQIVLIQLVYFIMKLFFALSMVKRYRHVMITDVYEAATAIFMSFDILRLFLIPSGFKKQKFSVTKKGNAPSQGVEIKYFFPVFLMTILLGVAMVKGVIDFLGNPPNAGAVGVNIFWNAYNLIVMLYATRVVVERPEMRKHLRIPTFINTKLINEINQQIPVSVLNLSHGGSLLRVMSQNVKSEEIENFFNENIYLLLPDGRREQLEIVQATIQNENIYFQVRFVHDYESIQNPQERMAKIRSLVNVMYENSQYWD